MNKRISLQKDQIKTLGIIALLIAGYALFVYLPSAQRRSALAHEIREAETALIQYTAPDQAAIDAQAEAARAALARDERPLPAGHEVFLVLDGISGAFLDHGIANHQLTQSDPKRYRDYAVQPIHIEFRGRFVDAFAVLKQIEKMTYPVRVDRMELASGVDQTTGEVTALVQLSAFFDTETGHE